MKQITADSRMIASAWTDDLAAFVENTQHELLLMSPWITTAAATLISHNLNKANPLKLQILARLHEEDFTSGTSHIEAFKPSMYPSSTNVEVRALPMLHGKMLVADRRRVIIGSANMTEGGLHRNHEVSLFLDSDKIGEECAGVFFRFWEKAIQLPEDYLSRLEEIVEETLPGDDSEENQSNRRMSLLRRRTTKLTRFGYVRPEGGQDARRHLSQLVEMAPIKETTSEDSKLALEWLNRTLRRLPRRVRGRSDVVQRIGRLMYHPDNNVRATAIDRAGRSGYRVFLDRLHALATNTTENEFVRSAAVFSLGLIGSPKAFPVLSSLVFDKAVDVRRWARRACFLLLNRVDYDESSWFFSELGVEKPATIRQIADQCTIDCGTVSERLTKALVIEKLAMDKWKDPDVEALVYIMKRTAEELSKTKRLSNLSEIVRTSADALWVRPGDLRHGPLSPTLLRRLTESGFSDSGLNVLLGEVWNRIHFDASVESTSFLSQPRFEPVLRALNQERD